MLNGVSGIFHCRVSTCFLGRLGHGSNWMVDEFPLESNIVMERASVLIGYTQALFRICWTIRALVYDEGTRLCLSCEAEVPCFEKLWCAIWMAYPNQKQMRLCDFRPCVIETPTTLQKELARCLIQKDPYPSEDPHRKVPTRSSHSKINETLDHPAWCQPISAKTLRRGWLPGDPRWWGGEERANACNSRFFFFARI